jgi:hypothetical protein
MTKQCLMRVRPADAGPFVSYHEWLEWPECMKPVVAADRFPVYGGMAYFCQDHADQLSKHLGREFMEVA